MKVTAIIPDALIKEAKILLNAKNITETIIIALNTYISLEKLKGMERSISEKPLQFRYTSQKIRDLNRL